MKTQVKFYKKTGEMYQINLIKIETFDSLNEALEAAEYFFHNYFWQAQVIDSNGDIYAEYEN